MGVLAHMADACFHCANRRAHYRIHPAACALSGYSKAELLTSRQWDIVTREGILNLVAQHETRSADCHSALLSAELVKKATLKVYKGGSHGICTTKKDQVNQCLL